MGEPFKYHCEFLTVYDDTVCMTQEKVGLWIVFLKLSGWQDHFLICV